MMKHLRHNGALRGMMKHLRHNGASRGMMKHLQYDGAPCGIMELSDCRNGSISILIDRRHGLIIIVTDHI